MVLGHAGEVLLGEMNAPAFAGAVVVLQWLWEVISRWTSATECASFDLRQKV